MNTKLTFMLVSCLLLHVFELNVKLLFRAAVRYKNATNVYTFLFIAALLIEMKTWLKLKILSHLWTEIRETATRNQNCHLQSSCEKSSEKTKHPPLLLLKLRLNCIAFERRCVYFGNEKTVCWSNEWRPSYVAWKWRKHFVSSDLMRNLSRATQPGGQWQNYPPLINRVSFQHRHTSKSSSHSSFCSHKTVITTAVCLLVWMCETWILFVCVFRFVGRNTSKTQLLFFDSRYMTPNFRWGNRWLV